MCHGKKRKKKSTSFSILIKWRWHVNWHRPIGNGPLMKSKKSPTRLLTVSKGPTTKTKPSGLPFSIWTAKWFFMTTKTGKIFCLRPIWGILSHNLWMGNRGVSCGPVRRMQNISLRWDRNWITAEMSFGI